MKRKQWFYMMLMLAAAVMGCRQLYAPPEIKASNRFLVVDGVINASPGDTTTIRLSRTRNLVDTLTTDPERGATVLIEEQSGTSYTLMENQNGTYQTQGINLPASGQYRLTIITSGGDKYQSDFVPVKITPPIDSLTWKQPDDLTIFVNTHDPQNNSRYYRWDYTETWEYHANLETILMLKNNLIYYTDSTNQIYKCWHTVNSTDIIIDNTLKLGQDVVHEKPVVVLPQNDERAAIRYSVLIRQYALTEKAYNYWEILQKNTQQLGSLFDGQPAQLKGNIHNVANPNEPVIGFVSASTIASQRIMIDSRKLTNWNPNPLTLLPAIGCDTLSIPQGPSWQDYNYPDTTYAPYYFTSGGGIVLTRRDCLDCRRMGGTNTKPSFW